MTKIPERFVWATTLLSIEPSDMVLEIGCGAGLLAEQIADKLIDGKLLGIDKSSSMINKAIHRNARFVKQKTSAFMVSDFYQAKLPDKSFDKVVAFNVNFFLKDTSKEFGTIKRILKPKGKVFVFYQAPFELDISFSKPITQGLTNNGFNILDTQIENLSPTSAICVIAQC